MSLVALTALLKTTTTYNIQVLVVLTTTLAFVYNLYKKHGTILVPHSNRHVFKLQLNTDGRIAFVSKFLGTVLADPWLAKGVVRKPVVIARFCDNFFKVLLNVSEVW